MLHFLLFVSKILTLPLLCAGKLSVIDDDFIDKINRNQNLWTAGKNFPENVTEDFIKALAGAEDPAKDLPTNNSKFHFVRRITWRKLSIPESFDAREKWPHCRTLTSIPDQGKCGNCWAVGILASLSDRLCIESGGKHDYQLSADEITRCCTSCSTKKNGCYGGTPTAALKYWLKNGLISGGHFKSKQGCRPYSEELHEYLRKHPKKGPIKYLKCTEQCSNNEYNGSYPKNRIRGYKVNVFRKKSQKIIQQEIVQNGPVASILKVYNDLVTYKNGIYVHQESKYIGMHCVTIIGWGTEKDVPYWLVRNTWAAKWGKMGGFFKIRRGVNEVNVETTIYGGLFYASKEKVADRHSVPRSSSDNPRLSTYILFINLLTFVLVS